MRILACVLMMLCCCFAYACKTPPQNGADTTGAPSASAKPGEGDPDTLPNDEPTPTPDVPSYNEYNVSLDIEPETRIVKGIERIRYTNRTGEAQSEIVCRLYLNAFSEKSGYKPYFTYYEQSIFPSGVDYGYMNILYISQDNDELEFSLSDSDTVLTVVPSQPIGANETVQIKIQFEAYVPRMNHRTGANNYAMWCGMFLPVLSVFDGGWHTEPFLPAGNPIFLETANYSVEITTPGNYTVAGTGIISETVTDEYKMTNLSAKMTRDFAFIVSPFFKTVLTETAVSGIDVILYHYSDSVPVDEIMRVAAASLEYFQSTVGLYPYLQLCIAEASIFTPSMEFSKFVLIDSAILQTPMRDERIVREIAHQWFFNVIGSNHLTDSWLSEGMSLYFTDTFFYPEPEQLAEAIKKSYKNLSDRYHNMHSEDGKRIASDLAIYNNWTDYVQIQQTKAKLMLYALHVQMGEEAFGALIKEYYKKFSFKNVTRGEFIDLAEAAYEGSLSGFFDVWLYSDSLPLMTFD